jgi:secreted Zn-dependent insulinase-like peptidase
LQALQGKYLDPAKSLHEAARRAWVPIHSRSLAFNRRQDKADAAGKVTQQQLLDFYDNFLSPQGQQHKALCVQIWGSQRIRSKDPEDTAPAADATIVQQQQQQQQQQLRIPVKPRDVAAFKLRQPLMPMADVVLPTAAAVEQTDRF